MSPKCTPSPVLTTGQCFCAAHTITSKMFFSLINIKDVLFSLNVSFCSFPLAFSCAYPKGKQVAFDISTRSKPSVLVYGKPYLSLFMSQGSAAPIAAEAEMDATPPCDTSFNGQPLHFFPWQSGAIKVSRQKSDGTLLSKAVWQR